VKLGKTFARTLGFLVLGVMILVVGLGLLFVQRDIDVMRQTGKENILWSAVQLEIELQRFQRTLADYISGNPDIGPENVNDRFDILWSRVSLFHEGTVGKRLRAYDAEDHSVVRLFQTMHRVEADVVHLGSSDRPAALAIQKSFQTFNSELRQISRVVLHGEERKKAVGRENLAASSLMLTITSAAAAIASLFLILVFARETRRYRLLAEENQKLLTKSNRANRAKSQFLAMMSHELRTPMNGVLGLLALARRQERRDQQSRLLAQAERSGQQMNSLLGDALDYAALQDDKLDLETKPFDPADLAKAVDDLFRPVAMREGTTFTTRINDSCPHRLIGDFSRLRQAISHLTTYILETAGAKDIRLDIDYDGTHMTAAISLDHSELGKEWNPGLIMGNNIFSEDSFASEALGPAVSRGLINHMGGTTKLDTPSDNRISILFSVPLPELVLDEIVIRVVSQSKALETICRAALRNDNICVLGPESPQEPNVILIEAGDSQEASCVARYGKMFPKAVLVALGRPQNPDSFFEVVDVPIDISGIKNSKFMRLIANGRHLVERGNDRYEQ